MNLGTLVKRRREELKLTQGELAEGVCTQALISKVERNLLNPSSKMIEKISKKLHVPVSYFYDEGSSIDPILNELEMLIRSSLNKTDYDNISYLLTVNENMIENANNNYFRVFFTWIKAILVFYKQENPKKAIKILENLNDMNDLSLDLAADVLSTLGIFYYESSNYKKANDYFSLALNKNNKEISFKKKVKIMYNYSLNLESLGNYKKALETILEAIDLLITNQSFYMLGYLYFHKAYLLRKFEERSEAILAYENAIFIFKLLGYNKMLTMARIELKEVKDNEKKEK